MDEPSAQLHQDIRNSVQRALAVRRPILHHLNADTTWLLQIPRPVNAIKHGARHFYNVFIDPWLVGGQSDVAKWFSQQFHADKSAVQSIAEVEGLAREIEILVAGLRLGHGRRSNASQELEDGVEDSFIDAIVISHEFTDHCHKETLLEVHPDVPVVATDQAAKLIRSWSHFRTVITTPIFSAEEGNRDWRSTSEPPLPDWLGVSRLVSKRDALNYHSAVMIAFNTCTPETPSSPHYLHSKKNRKRAVSDAAEAEAILYTPHGLASHSVSHLTLADPPIRTLAFLHGLHDVRIGSAQQLNLGGHNGLKAQRTLKARYWIGTHDEIKTGGGLVAWFLRRKVVGLGEALKEERRELEGKYNEDGEMTDWERHSEKEVLRSFDGVNWVELGNGESRVLS